MSLPDQAVAAAPPAFRPRSLAYYVLRLLRLHLRMGWSVFKHASLGRKFWRVVGYLIVVVFIAGIAWVSGRVFQFLDDSALQSMLQGQEFNRFLQNIPSLLLFAVFIGVLISGFGMLLQGLYLSGDMDFLVSAPLPMRAVFVFKLLQAIFPNFAMMSAMALPILFSLGAALEYHFLYYVMTVAQMLFLALAAAGASSLLVLVVVRWFDPRRVAEVLAFVGAALSLLCSQGGNLMMASDYDPLRAGPSAAQIEMVMNWAELWNPLAWPGLSLVQIGNRQWAGLLLLGATGLFSLGVFWLAMQTAERLYYSGWANVRVSPRRNKRQATRRWPWPLSQLAGWVETESVAGLRPLLSLMWKDALVLRRDLRNLSQVLTPAIIGLVYAFLLFDSDGESLRGRGLAPDWFLQQAPVYASLGIAMFVSWSLLSRLALSSFSQEGVSYWLLKSAPLSAARLLTAKFAFAYLPALALASVFVLLSFGLQAAPWGLLPFTWLTLSLWLAGLTGMNLAFGIAGARLDWEQARQMIGTGVGCVSSLCSMVYMGVGAAFFLAPPLAAGLLGLPLWLGQAAGLMLGGGWSLFFVLIPLWWAAKRLPRLGDDA